MTITFKNLDLAPQILKALEHCGYTTPTPVQAKSIPEILAGKDVVASAQTGTGKTASFVLPALHKLIQGTSTKKPRVLILTPTRELAAQITQAADKYGRGLNLKIVSLVGGMGYHQQVKNLSRPLDIVVATPGRLMDHMDNRRIDLSQVEMFILDEADRMLDMGFVDDVKTIAKKLPEHHQTLLFSATVDKQLNNIIKQLLKNPVRIDFAHEALAPERIQQVMYLTDSHQHKTEILEHLLAEESIFKAVIFTATKRSADQLAMQLKEDGISAAALHGDLKQAARNRTVDMMRKGKIQFLVATDVAARGIDISDITHVINYDLPKFSEDYVHRIGRTGRAGKTGIAISLVLPSDAKALQNIERYINQKLERATIPGLEPKKPMPNAGQSESRKSSGGRGRARPGQGGRFSERSFGNKHSDRSTDRSVRSGEVRFSADQERRPKRSGYSERPAREGSRKFGNQEGIRRSSFSDRPARTAERRFGDEDNRRSSYSERPARASGRRFADQDGNRQDRSRRFSNEAEGRRSSFSERSAEPRRTFYSDQPGSHRSSQPTIIEKKKRFKKPGKKF